MSEFDTESFINAVRERPCLWDLSTDDYANRVLKKQTWEELTLLFGGTDCITQKEKSDLCDAIKCHMCTSASDSKCGDPIDSSVALTECTPNILKDGASMLKDAAEAVSGILGKIGIDSNIAVPDANSIFACAKAVRQDGDKKVVIRSCTVPKNDKFDMCSQLKAQSSGGVVTFCDTCESDGCNGAAGVTPTSLLVLLAAALGACLLSLRQ